MEDLQQKVDDLRRQLNGGNFIQPGRVDSPGSASGHIEPNNTSINRPQRRTGENIRATNSGTTRGKTLNSTGKRVTSSSKRVPETVLAGVRPSTDGHEQDNSSSDSSRYDDKGIATRGRLIRDESNAPERNSNPITTNIFTPSPRRGPGRPKKSQEDEENSNAVVSPITRPSRPNINEQVAKRFNWFNQTNTLTEHEAHELVKPLGAALVDYGGYIDEYARIKMGNPEVVFFSDLSYEEGEVLAKVLLRLGKNNAQVATATRTMVNGNDYISAVIILWPRLMRLVEAMRPDGILPVPSRPQREKKPGLFYRPPMVEKAMKEKE